MRLGVDLGGTKIAAVVLGDDGRECWAARAPTPRDDYAGTLEAIADLVAQGERAVRAVCTVGVGIPGAISPATGLIKNANSTWINGRDCRHDLGARLGRDVRMANDANCLALSESVDGAAAGAGVVFAVILGTGTGGGLVVHGQLIVGRNAIAGEWGHTALPWPDEFEWPGPECYCGRRGCVETFLSGPGIAADYARRGGQAGRSEEIVARADAGERLALETLATWETRVAKALSTVINVVDPDVIVVGGGLSRLSRLYDVVPGLWGRWAFSDRVTTALVPAAFGDASGVRGAARLWPDDAALSRR